MSRVAVANRVHRDLDEIWMYIGENRSVRQADAVVDAIVQAFGKIGDNPGVGTERAERAGWRSYAVKGYLIMFSRVGDGVEIHCVVHGARDMTAFLDGPQY